MTKSDTITSPMMTVLFNVICARSIIQDVLFFVLFFICLTFYMKLLWKKRHMLIKSWNVPGPFNFPFIGSAYVLFCRPKYAMDNIIRFQQKYPKGGKAWLGYKLFYFLHEPDHIKRILGDAKFVDKDLLYNEFRSCIGEGLLTAPLAKWKRNRRIISSSFNQHVLNGSVNTFAEKSAIFNKILDENCKTELSIEKFLTRCILDITLETLLGVHLDIQKTNARYADLMKRMFSLIFKKIWVKLTFWNIFDNKELELCRNEIDNIIEKAMQEKSESSHKENLTELCKEVRSKHLALLDNIMNSGKFDAFEVKEEIIVFVGAAADTSITAINSIFAVLGMFPQIQQKVYKEIIEVMGDDGLPRHDNLHQMIYMERVINETLRLFPPAPNFLRFIREDVDVGEFVIPKGANVLFNLLYIHRNPKYWPNPLKFDPDRFLPEEVAKRYPCTYMPFSYGQRNCIGFQYAMMNMKVILSTVIRKFKIHCDYKRIEDIHFKLDFVLKFRDGTKVSLTPRT